MVQPLQLSRSDRLPAAKPSGPIELWEWFFLFVWESSLSEYNIAV